MSTDRIGEHQQGPADHFAERLDIAVAEKLRHGLHPLSLASILTCLGMAALWWLDNPDIALGPWLALGGLVLVLRLFSLRPLPDHLTLSERASGARRILWVAVAASAAAGLMLAWGWVVILPQSAGVGLEALRIAHVAVLLVCLCASGSHVPSFLAMVLTSTAPLFLTLGQDPAPYNPEPLFLIGLGIVSVVAAAFSVRFSKEFHDTFALRNRVERLLDEVSVKRDEAVLATQAKSRFLASVSHDLRQPMHALNLYLASVAGHFDRLRAAPGDPACARQVQDGILSLQESSLYLNAMFESLLDISRLNTGSVPVDIRHTSLNRLMAQLESDYRRLADNQGLHFEMCLPPQFHLMEVDTDPNLLERLLRNFLVNAFRYTRTGGVRLSVRVKGRELDFRVVDTGPGIERALRHRVFEEFFQVPGSQETRAAPGTSEPTAPDLSPTGWKVDGLEPMGRGIGLGLSISARLADKLRAPIRLHSWRYKGSVFALRQPMRIALRPRTDGPPKVIGTAHWRPAGRFLVVIDDDREIRRSTSQMLQVFGAEVFTAESAAQAVQHLGRLGRVPDLVLSDYRLGPENGVEAIARLREEFNQDIPAILITGDTSPERIEEFRRSGLQVLYKPLAGAQLLSAVEAALQPAVSSAAP